MATLVKDMSTDEKIRWYRKHLYSISGGFKKGLSYDEIMAMLNPLVNLQTAKLLGMA